MITIQHIANYIAQAGHTASGYEQQLLEKFKNWMESLEAPAEPAPEPAPVVEAAPEPTPEPAAAVAAFMDGVPHEQFDEEAK
jgi:hypothetical protein